VVPEIGHRRFPRTTLFKNLIIVGRWRQDLTCINRVATNRTYQGILEIERLVLAEIEKSFIWLNGS
jgi:hypothetical protein